MLSRSFFQGKLKLNHIKHKQLPPQVLFATLTLDDQGKLKPVHCLVKHETVLPSLEDDCHPGLAHFGKDQFPIGNHNEREKNVIKSLESFSIDNVQPIQVPFKISIRKNARTLIQQFLFDTYIEDPVGSRKPQDNNPFRTDLVLVHEVD